MDATNKKDFGVGQVPLTPPRMNDALPTPPTSHIELSNVSQVPLLSSVNHHQNVRIGEPSSPPQTSEQLSQSPPLRGTTSANMIETEGSPSITAHQRKVKRISTGASQPSIVMESNVPADHTENGTERGRSRQPHQNGAGSPSRSRTPSPILGSAFAGRDGRLSFNVALEPSPEEVRSLLYGDANEKEEESRPQTIRKGEVDELMLSLSSMGLDQVDEEMQSSDSNEKRLASMVKKLVNHVQKQDKFIDQREEVLHNTRIRSIAMLSSLRTSFAHTFVAEYELRARLEAELEGAKLQARKLSQLLARSESRNEELDRERAMSAEEEILWQEEMKDHMSAYAKQQAARAKAAQLLQAPPNGNAQQKESTKQDVPSSIENVEVTPDKSQPATGLDEAFEEKKVANGVGNLPQSVSDSSLAGLGISSGAAGPSVTIDGVSAPAGSPLSTIIKERNKLLADKRYLKNRVRDSEAQRERLELELKSLRPLLVRGVPAKNTVASQLSSTPNTPSRSQKRDRSRRRRQAMMGDAEAEHLLLAARRLQSTRAGKNIDENGRPVTPPPAVSSSTSNVNPRTPRTPRIAQTPRSTAAMMDSVTQSAASSRMATDSVFTASNASPLAGKNGPMGRWGTHQRTDSARSIGGIDDLLQAAQTVLTPGERLRQQQELQRKQQQSLDDGDEDADVGDVTARNDVEIEDDERMTRPNDLLSKLDRSALQSSTDESPKRRRVSSADIKGDRRHSSLLGSPDKSSFLPSARRLRTQTEGGDPHSSIMPNASQASALSALDLLADQAAASQQPSQSSEQSNSGEGEMFGGGDSDDGDDGMHVDHIGANGIRPLNSHYYPRGAYGHAYAHPPLNHEPYRLPNQPAAYAYGPQASPVQMSSSQGWTSQNMPPGRNGIYSPPTAHHARFALQGGPRISSGYVPNMQDGARMANGGNQMMHASMMNGSGGGGGGGMGMGMGMGMNGGGYSDEEGSPTQRTPQRGGNTSPDKRLPYVRWSEDEDQRLRRAIKEYGQRWESVAREVGTRTYHQCRQRYLLMRRKENAKKEGHNGSGEEISSTA